MNLLSFTCQVNKTITTTRGRPRALAASSGNELLSRAGSFIAPTGLLSRSSLSDDAPVSTGRFIFAFILSVRLLPALLPLLPSSHVAGNILAFKVQSKNTIFINK
ncbi:hypothetical protein T10_1082 [Trichinella papuae]|uniref:Uncharacterized protein n=1 Tax=Trichinella papuae TaxID=268474 RepID=A0A0V1M2T8_9BILA|nr:hypothetical protein T10_6019 [Trichinella papuae]KRZ65868.1 hypothetical protein T10_1082 [Trichinella papuae]